MRFNQFVLLLAWLWTATGVAQQSGEKPAENPLAAAEQPAQAAIAHGLRWLTSQQCTSCHFSVPSNDFHSFAHQHGKVNSLWIANSLENDRLIAACLRNSRPAGKETYLGVSLSPVPAVLRQHVKTGAPFGLLVESVEADSPAQAAGVDQYDILEKLNDQRLVNSEQFSVLIRTYKPGDEVHLSLIHESQPKTVVAKLGERAVAAAEATIKQYELGSIKQYELANVYEFLAADQLSQAAAAEKSARTSADGSGAANPPPVTYLGVSTVTPPDALVEQLRLTKGLGLLVESVEDGSPAAAAGIKQHDLLDKLDDQLLVNAEQFTALVRSRKPGEEVRLGLRRDGQQIVVVVALGKREDPPAVGSSEPINSNIVLDGNLEFEKTLTGNTITHAGLLTLDAQPDALRNLIALKFDYSESIDDATYARRVWLDTIGLPPPAEDLKKFVADKQPDKRKRLVDELLTRPEAISKFNGAASVVWSDKDHALTLTCLRDGPRHLLVEDRGGTTLFDGTVTTETEQAQLPAAVRPKLARMLVGLDGDNAAGAASATPGEAAGRRLLDQILPSVELDGATFDQAIEALRKQAAANIVVHRAALERAGVVFDEPLSLSLRDVKLSSALKTLLTLAGGKSPLRYTLADDVIVISTADRIERQ